MNEKFLEVGDVMQILGISRSAAYKLMRQINSELGSRKRSIKNEEQYREYQMWHVEVQEELDELKQEKKEIKRSLQLVVDGIMKKDLYTAYYAVSEKEEFVPDREIEIPRMEEDMLVERTAEAVVEPETNVTVMNYSTNSYNDGDRQKEQTDITGKNKFLETKETELVDKAYWSVRRISEIGGFQNISDSVKADIFGFDISDVSGSIRLFSDVMKRLGIKLGGDELYEGVSEDL